MMDSSDICEKHALSLDSHLRDDAVLERTLVCERSRADRTGGAFSLVTITAARDSDRSNKMTVENLTRQIRRRARCIDPVGLTRSGIAWQILPGCSNDSAIGVGDYICRTLREQGIDAKAATYHYAAMVDNDGHTHLDNDTKNQRCLRRPSLDHRCSGFEPSTSPDGVFFVASAHRLAALTLQRICPWKRLVDIVVAVFALFCLLPVFATISLAIKLTSPGPVFFVQWRTGRGGVPFRMFKFRSMVADAEQRKHDLLAANERDGPAFKIKSDPRVTKIGSILRKTALDELPQFWNVLLGDMSLVGPRPLPCGEAAQCVNWQQEREHVTPGMTCSWQITPARARVPFDEWMRMDIRYIRHRSLATDIKLIVRTAMLPFVISRTMLSQNRRQ